MSSTTKPRSVNTSVWESNSGSVKALRESDWQLEDHRWFPLCYTEYLVSNTSLKRRQSEEDEDWRTSDTRKTGREGGHVEEEATHLGEARRVYCRGGWNTSNVIFWYITDRLCVHFSAHVFLTRFRRERRNRVKISLLHVKVAWCEAQSDCKWNH